MRGVLQKWARTRWWGKCAGIPTAIASALAGLVFFVSRAPNDGVNATRQVTSQSNPVRQAPPRQRGAAPPARAAPTVSPSSSRVPPRESAVLVLPPKANTPLSAGTTYPGGCGPTVFVTHDHVIFSVQLEPSPNDGTYQGPIEMLIKVSSTDYTVRPSDVRGPLQVGWGGRSWSVDANLPAENYATSGLLAEMKLTLDKVQGDNSELLDLQLPLRSMTVGSVVRVNYSDVGGGKVDIGLEATYVMGGETISSSILDIGLSCR